MVGDRQGLIQSILGKLNLRFPTLFLVFLGLTAADLLLPDPIPFVDEIALALLTLMIGMWKDRRRPPVIDARVVPPVNPSR